LDIPAFLNIYLNSSGRLSKLISPVLSIFIDVLCLNPVGPVIFCSYFFSSLFTPKKPLSLPPKECFSFSAFSCAFLSSSFYFNILSRSAFFGAIYLALSNIFLAS